MALLIGLVMFLAGITVVVLGRPAAGGRFAAFVARPGMGTAAALVFTVLVCVGLAIAIGAVVGIAF